MTDQFRDAQPAGALYIDGRFAKGEGAALDVRYPFTGQVIARLAEASDGPGRPGLRRRRERPARMGGAETRWTAPASCTARPPSSATGPRSWHGWKRWTPASRFRKPAPPTGRQAPTRWNISRASAPR